MCEKSPMASRNQLQPLCGSVVFCSAHPILSHCCLLGRRHADLSLDGEAENESASTNMGAANFSSRPHNTPDEMVILRSNGSLIEVKACRNQTSMDFFLKLVAGALLHAPRREVHLLRSCRPFLQPLQAYLINRGKLVGSHITARFCVACEATTT